MNRADEYEYEVANHINLPLFGLTAIKKSVSTKYSDVLLENNGKTSWLEVKMNKFAQLGCPRFHFVDDQWSVKSPSKLKNFCIDKLNDSDESVEFINALKEYTGKEYFILSSNKGDLKNNNVIQLEVLREFLKTRKNKYVLDERDIDLGQVVCDHYVEGKLEPAHYASIGDDFYRLSDDNPLNLPMDIPMLSGNGNMQVSVVARTNFYEIMPRIKIKDFPHSDYSTHPNTIKKCPFI